MGALAFLSLLIFSLPVFAQPVESIPLWDRHSRFFCAGKSMQVCDSRGGCKSQASRAAILIDFGKSKIELLSGDHDSRIVGKAFKIHNPTGVGPLAVTNAVLTSDGEFIGFQERRIKHEDGRVSYQYEAVRQGLNNFSLNADDPLSANTIFFNCFPKN